MPVGAFIVIALLLLFGAAFIFGRRFAPRSNDPCLNNYYRARTLLILYATLFGLELFASFEGKGDFSFKHWLPTIAFGICLAFAFFGFFHARRKAFKAGLLKSPARISRIFFWQVALILLPVVGLSVLGLFSLREDHLLAQQQAKELGRSIAQQFSQAIGDELTQQLRDYREANFELNANQAADLGLSQWAGGFNSENQAWQRIKAWQQANPEIDLPAMPISDCRIGFRPKFYSSPEIYSPAPQPPDWLRQLTPQQKQLWQTIKEMSASKNFSAMQSAVEKFIATKPSNGAHVNTEYLLLLAKTHGMPANEAVTKIAEFSRSHWGSSDQLTDAGLPIGQLICYQALRQLPDGAGLPKEFIHYHTIAWMINYQPSFFSAKLIAEAQRVAHGTSLEKNMATLNAWWESNEKTRRILSSFQEQHPTNMQPASTFWITSSSDDFLLMLDSGYQTTNNSSPEISHSLLIFPEIIVDKALNLAAIKSDISVPPYAVVKCEIAGRKFNLSRSKISETDTPSLLAEADGNLKYPSLSAAYPFQVRVFLTRPDILYARQRERTWIFGALIIASALAALLGLLGAYRSFRRQQELNALKSNFVSSVSHELRAPIASVRLMAENLERGKIADAPKQNEYFRFIVQECRRLSSLIENVLDFSRIEQNRKQYEFEPTDLNLLARETVKAMEPYAAEKEIQLRMETSNIQHSTSNIEFNVDGRAIQQALINLIDNAIKHSPKGETVTLGLDYGQRRTGATPVLLSVADRGPGIPREEHEKIFERFYRRGSELRRETQGVGIGLSIVKHIVEAHGGNIFVESEPGKGSKFTIVLPVKNKTTDEHR